MNELLNLALSWQTFLLSLLVFGFAPGLALRLIVLALPSDDLRRHELRAELSAVPRWERPLWVAEQVEVALIEGLWFRLRWAAEGRIVGRWHLASGVERNRDHPDTFWIPSPAEKASIEPGDDVKLMFDTSGWGERMWVTVTRVGPQGRLVGELCNQPVGIARLDSGKKIKFRYEHIIDIWGPGHDDALPATADELHADALEWSRRLGR